LPQFRSLTAFHSQSDDAQGADKLDRLQRDLDVICLKTISTLLDRLPLLLADDALLLDDKVEWAKSRQFSLYFNYFIKVLNRTRAIEDAAGDRVKASAVLEPQLKAVTSNLTSATASSSSTLPIATSSKHSREQLQQTVRELAPLKDSAILALSNLLASNIDSGLQHSLPLAYQPDDQLRAAFMQIMTNVLNQGTAFDDLERLSAAQKQSKLVELVCQNDLHLALSICNVCRGYDSDQLDYVLLSIFDSRGGIIRFLKAALGEEIDRTATEEMVFRSNSFRTHLLSVFGRTHGYEYLRSIMAPLITEMANKPRGYSFEIDPSRLEPGESALVNQHRLEEMAQAFIDQICSSAHRVPAVLRELCRHIRTLMDDRFPNSRYQGVGGFMFLRFISPAVVAPQIIDINLTGPGKELRRGLLLISKILQTLASNNFFPAHKEPFMTSLNDFLKRNVWRVTTFLDQVSDARTDPERLLAADQPLGYGIHPYGYGIDKADQRMLHRFLFQNVDKIGQDIGLRSMALASAASSAGVGSPVSPSVSLAGLAGSASDGGVSATPTSSSDPKRVYDQLCHTLADLGECEDNEPTLSFSNQAAGDGKQAFQDFLRRNTGRNVDEKAYRSVFREGPPSKAGRTVFYYNITKQNAKTMDYEGLIIYVLQCLESCLSRPFDLVIDCTGVHPSNLTPPQWMSYFGSLVPGEVVANLRNIIVFNMNTAARLYLRPWQGPLDPNGTNGGAPAGSPRNALADVPAHISIACVSSISEMEAFVERRNIALDPQTVTIATSVSDARFNQVTMVWYYRSLVPVTFRIGAEHLQITALKQQEIGLGNRTAFTNDVFHLADIDDVRAVSIRGDDNTFFVTCRGGSISFLFNSRDRADIVQGLRQAKARVSRFRPTNAIDRTLLPSDVPGTLLNMALLNSTSSTHSLRASAYNLLCALSRSFNFGASNAGKRLLSTKGEYARSVQCATGKLTHAVPRPGRAREHHGVHLRAQPRICRGGAGRDARVPALLLRGLRARDDEPEDDVPAVHGAMAVEPGHVHAHVARAAGRVPEAHQGDHCAPHRHHRQAARDVRGDAARRLVADQPPRRPDPDVRRGVLRGRHGLGPAHAALRDGARHDGLVLVDQPARQAARASPPRHCQDGADAGRRPAARERGMEGDCHARAHEHGPLVYEPSRGPHLPPGAAAHHPPPRRQRRRCHASLDPRHGCEPHPFALHRPVARQQAGDVHLLGRAWPCLAAGLWRARRPGAPARPACPLFGG
jgi:neurofibromin 1